MTTATQEAYREAQAKVDELQSLLVDYEAAMDGSNIALAQLRVKLASFKADADSEKGKRTQEKIQAESENLKKRISDIGKIKVEILEAHSREAKYMTLWKKELAEEGLVEDNKRGLLDTSASAALSQGRSNMQGSSVQQVPLFSGVYGPEAEAWIKLVSRAKLQFGWTSSQTAQMVRGKLTGAAAYWADNQENHQKNSKGLLEWDSELDGADNFKEMLLKKFTVAVSATAATIAIDNLKQKQEESVDSFYERVRYAVSKLLFINQGAPNYVALFDNMIWVFFKSGLKPVYIERIFSADPESQPKTEDKLFEAAKSAERATYQQRNAARLLTRTVNALETPFTGVTGETEGGTGVHTTAPPSAQHCQDYLELRRELDAIYRGGRRGRGGRGGRGRGRGFGTRHLGTGANTTPIDYSTPSNLRGTGGAKRTPAAGDKCFNCNQMGHWAGQCPKPKNIRFKRQLRHYCMEFSGAAEEMAEMDEDNVDRGDEPLAALTYEDDVGN